MFMNGTNPVFSLVVNFSMRTWYLLRGIACLEIISKSSLWVNKFQDEQSEAQYEKYPPQEMHSQPYPLPYVHSLAIHWLNTTH